MLLQYTFLQHQNTEFSFSSINNVLLDLIQFFLEVLNWRTKFLSVASESFLFLTILLLFSLGLNVFPLPRLHFPFQHPLNDTLRHFFLRPFL